MKKYVTQCSITSFLWILIVCYTTIMTYGQNTLQKYYEYINEAELAVCRENYKVAGEFYKQAFMEFPPFGRDLHFASTLNYKYLHNEEEALKYAYILRQMNYDIAQYFLDDTEKEEYPDLQKKLEMMQDTIKVLVINELEKALEKLYDADQKPRQTYLEYYPEDKNYTYYNNNIRFVDSVNRLELQALYKKYGEIHERNAGMGFSYGSANLVLLHNTSWLYNPDNIILKEVMKGNFDARCYMTLKERYLNTAEEMSHYAVLNVTMFGKTLFILDPEDIEQINQNRKAINIAETWDDFKEKVLHRFYEKNYDFRFQNLFRLFYNSDEENLWKSQIDSGEMRGAYFTKE